MRAGKDDEAEQDGETGGGTPNTPAARSPSVKKPSSGARRLTRSIAAIAIAVDAAITSAAQTMFTESAGYPAVVTDPAEPLGLPRAAALVATR